MAIFSTTMKAHWRESQEVKPCVECKQEGLKTFQTGHKSRGDREVFWWPEYHICGECKSKLPSTAPE